MSGYSFGVGKYPMKNGGTATVLSVLPKPNDTVCDRIGYFTLKGFHYPLSWSEDGSAYGYTSDFNLMPPAMHSWRNLYSTHQCGFWLNDLAMLASARDAECIGALERITRPGEPPKYVFHDIEEVLAMEAQHEGTFPDNDRPA